MTRQFYEIQFTLDEYDDEQEIWIVEAETMTPEIASDIVRSVCAPHEFGSVHFSVFEITYNTEGSNNRQDNQWRYGKSVNAEKEINWVLRQSKNKSCKYLFKMSAWSIEDMIYVMHRFCNSETLDQFELRDLAISLKANERTISEAMNKLRVSK